MEVTNGEVKAWLEGSSQPNQTRGEPSPQKNKQYEDTEEASENEEVLEGSEDNEEHHEEDDEELDEHDGEEDVDEEDEELEHSEEEAQDEEHDENQQTDRNQEKRENNKSNINSARLPEGSPVKRAYTTEKDNRKRGPRALMSHRDKSPNDAKYNSDRAVFEKLTGKSLSPTRHPEEFKTYYEKFCKEFLQKREDELQKKRRQKEEDELAQLQHKPTLISRPQSKPYVPLLERTALLDARREKELEKIRKEKEEKLQKELEEHTFAPKINQRSKNLANSPVRERIIDHYNRSRLQFSQSPLPQRKERDTFQPQINPNSRNIMAMKEETSRDVVDRLYHKADLGKTRKNELAKQLTPKFTPSLNKNTRKIAKQIEDNYHNGLASAGGKQQRVEKRKRSEIESEGTSQNIKRDVAHLEQASDFELLEVLKQFNGMLEQKNESPINLQQLSTLMQTYSEKKKNNKEADENGDFNREETEEQEQEEEEGAEEVYDEEEEDDYDSSQRRVHTEQPVRSYPSGAFDDATNPMSNIEKNLMHIQGSLQDLKGNEHRASLRHQGPSSHHEEQQSSSYSPNKKAPSSKGSKKKSKHNEGSRNEVNTEEYSEGVSSKNSIGGNGASEKSGSKSQRAQNTEKSMRSSFATPSKSEVNYQAETKAPGSTRSAKKEDFSSPAAVQKGRKKAQTSAKKSKAQTLTDQPAQSVQNKEVKSLNEVFASNSKNSLEACNSNFEVEDYVEATRAPNRQPKERVKGHTPHQSFGGYQAENLHIVGQEESNYRSNRPQEQEKAKKSTVRNSVGSRGQIADQYKGKSNQALDIEEQSDTYSDEDRYEQIGKIDSQSNLSQKRVQTQSNVSSKNKIPDSKPSFQQKTPEKRHSTIVKSVAREESAQKRTPEKRYSTVVKSFTRDEEKQHDMKSASANGKDKTRKSEMLDDRNSEHSQNLLDQQEENSRSRSRNSRQVSFEMPLDSRKSSIYEISQEQRLATEPESNNKESKSQQTAGSGRVGTELGKGSNPIHRKSVQEPIRQNKDQAKGGQRKSMYEQGRPNQQENAKASGFANKGSNKKVEPEPIADDDDYPSIQREKTNIGDYMSFSANTLDQQPSFDDHQAPQDEKRLLDTFESEESKTSSKPSAHRTNKHSSPKRSHFDVVTTETIQIEPQSAPRFAYAMDVAEKVMATSAAAAPVSSSGSGLKAMAEQIVKKFKAYDAQIKQTAREYKLSVSPPRTTSPSPDHYDVGHLDSGSKKEKTKVFKSVVEKGGAAKASRASRNSVAGAGSITSVQSGADRRFSKR